LVFETRTVKAAANCYTDWATPVLLLTVMLIITSKPITYTLIGKDEGKGKGVPRHSEVAQGGSGRLRLRIFMTFGTIKEAVRSSPLRTGRLYPQEFSWYSFLEAESTPGHMVPSVATEKIPCETNGDRYRDPPTSSALVKTKIGLKYCICSYTQ
jgi:hypothetical protein